MVCLGLEPGVAGWKMQTNPLSYGGTPNPIKLFSDAIAVDVLNYGKIYEFSPYHIGNRQFAPNVAKNLKGPNTLTSST